MISQITAIVITLLITIKLSGQLPTDKMLHFSAGYIICTSAGSLSYHLNSKYPVTVGVSLGVAAGVGKEVRDYYTYGQFDVFDLMFTAEGVIFGGTCIKVFFVPQHERRKRKPIQF